MKTGNIVINKIPEELTTGICSCCLCECKEIPIDVSFSDQYGLVERWETGSDCCHEQVLVDIDSVNIC